MTARKTMAWKGRRFVRIVETPAHCTWVSEAVGEYGRPIWKAKQYAPGEVWFARLRLGPIRLHHTGTSAALALDAVAAEASRLAGLLVDVGCGPDAL